MLKESMNLETADLNMTSNFCLMGSVTQGESWTILLNNFLFSVRAGMIEIRILSLMEWI